MLMKKTKKKLCLNILKCLLIKTEETLEEDKIINIAGI